MTPAPADILHPNFDEQMNEVNFEFSDIELELEEPVLTRTRSQSRAKENSVPPTRPSTADPTRKSKVKRGAKKIDPDYVEKPHRLRRRAINEEPEPAVFSTDDD